MSAGRKTYAELEAAVRAISEPIEGEGRSHHEWLQWVIERGAIELLGELTPFEAALIECVVKQSGTFRFSPNSLHDPFPGVPEEWLCSGGPDGTDKRLMVRPGRALQKRIREFQEKLETLKSRGVGFYVKQLPKSQYGFAGYETAARPVLPTVDLPGGTKPNANALRLGRAKT